MFVSNKPVWAKLIVTLPRRLSNSSSCIVHGSNSTDKSSVRHQRKVCSNKSSSTKLSEKNANKTGMLCSTNRKELFNNKIANVNSVVCCSASSISGFDADQSIIKTKQNLTVQSEHYLTPSNIHNASSYTNIENNMTKSIKSALHQRSKSFIHVTELNLFKKRKFFNRKEKLLLLKNELNSHDSTNFQTTISGSNTKTHQLLEVGNKEFKLNKNKLNIKNTANDQPALDKKTSTYKLNNSLIDNKNQFKSDSTLLNQLKHAYVKAGTTQLPNCSDIKDQVRTNSELKFKEKPSFKKYVPPLTVLYSKTGLGYPTILNNKLPCSQSSIGYNYSTTSILTNDGTNHATKSAESTNDLKTLQQSKSDEATEISAKTSCICSKIEETSSLSSKTEKNDFDLCSVLREQQSATTKTLNEVYGNQFTIQPYINEFRSTDECTSENPCQKSILETEDKPYEGKLSDMSGVLLKSSSGDTIYESSNSDKVVKELFKGHYKSDKEKYKNNLIHTFESAVPKSQHAQSTNKLLHSTACQDIDAASKDTKMTNATDSSDLSGLKLHVLHNEASTRQLCTSNDQRSPDNTQQTIKAWTSSEQYTADSEMTFKLGYHDEPQTGNDSNGKQPSKPPASERKKDKPTRKAPTEWNRTNIYTPDSSHFYIFNGDEILNDLKLHKPPSDVKAVPWTCKQNYIPDRNLYFNFENTINQEKVNTPPREGIAWVAKEIDSTPKSQENIVYDSKVADENVGKESTEGSQSIPISDKLRSTPPIFKIKLVKDSENIKKDKQEVDPVTKSNKEKESTTHKTSKPSPGKKGASSSSGQQLLNIEGNLENEVQNEIQNLIESTGTIKMETNTSSNKAKQTENTTNATEEVDLDDDAVKKNIKNICKSMFDALKSDPSGNLLNSKFVIPSVPKKGEIDQEKLTYYYRKKSEQGKFNQDSDPNFSPFDINHKQEEGSTKDEIFNTKDPVYQKQMLEKDFEQNADYVDTNGPAVDLRKQHLERMAEFEEKVLGIRPPNKSPQFKGIETLEEESNDNIMSTSNSNIRKPGKTDYDKYLFSADPNENERPSLEDYYVFLQGAEKNGRTDKNSDNLTNKGNITAAPLDKLNKRNKITDMKQKNLDYMNYTISNTKPATPENNQILKEILSPENSSTTQSEKLNLQKQMTEGNQGNQLDGNQHLTTTSPLLVKTFLNKVTKIGKTTDLAGLQCYQTPNDQTSTTQKRKEREYMKIMEKELDDNKNNVENIENSNATKVEINKYMPNKISKFMLQSLFKTIFNEERVVNPGCVNAEEPGFTQFQQIEKQKEKRTTMLLIDEMHPMLNPKKYNFEYPTKVNCITNYGCDGRYKHIPTVSKILNETLSNKTRGALQKWNKTFENAGESKLCQSYQGHLENYHQYYDCLRRHILGTPLNLLMENASDETKGCFLSILNILSKLEDVTLLETPVVHSTLPYYGIVDCVAKYKGEPYVIEWKQASSPKVLKELTNDAPIQVAAYLGALNHDNQFKFPVKSGMIVVGYTDGSPADVFPLTTEDCQKYWKLWLKRLQSYINSVDESTKD